MEGVAVIGVALDNFLDLAVNLHFDYILSAQRNRRAQDLLQDEETRSALRAWRPRIDDVRSACMLLADQHESLDFPAAAAVPRVASGSSFHQDFSEWLHVGAIEAREAVKARMIQLLETPLAPAQISEEQRQFLQQHFFAASKKAIAANDALAR